MKIELAKTKDLPLIIDLQQRNLRESVETHEAQKEGFVTVCHTLNLLERMNEDHPHIVAIEKGKVVGYALIMPRSFADEIPILKPMQNQTDRAIWREKPLSTINYFFMGQICIEKAFRGKGLFKKMYQKMQCEMEEKFDCVITEVDDLNPRSIRAHEKVGFKTIHQYTANGQSWRILLWDWNS